MRNYSYETIKLVEEQIHELEKKHKNGKLTLKESKDVDGFYTEYITSYSNGIDVLFQNKEKLYLKYMTLFNIHHYLELWIKDLIWSRGEGGSTIKDYDLDHHNLLKVLSQVDNKELLCNYIEEEDYIFVLDFIKEIYKIGKNDFFAMISRYPVFNKKNTLPFDASTMKKITMQSLEKNWIKIKEMYSKSILLGFLEATKIDLLNQ